MNREEISLYVCPVCHKPLTVNAENEHKKEILSGSLSCCDHSEFPVQNGIPDLIHPLNLSPHDSSVQSFYDNRAKDYDENLHLTFKTHSEDEEKVRNSFIDSLELTSSSKVLEVACGTGRDSEIISQRLGVGGRLCLQDIAQNMLERCQTRLTEYSVPKSFCLSNACFLPYPDNTFDALYSFGGLGEFSDIKGSLAEMVRVCKVGAKIVVGDESMPPWLHHTEFAKILITTNKQFLAEVPLKDIPVEARGVCLRWVIGGVFYLIDFRVGEGEPTGDFDFEIPGVRGGTLRTRYEGQLEGITPEAKRLAYLAREKRNVSMHKWLDEVVRESAKLDLGEV